MKYYDYSVKNILTDYFGEDTVFAMRKPHESVHKSEDDVTNLLQLEWQYADEEAMHLFVDSVFLADTVLCDDYIAYLGHFGEEKIAYLMFMLTEDEPNFHIETRYAKKLISEWSEKGYKTFILRECIGIEYCGNDQSRGYYFRTHSTQGFGHALYEIKSVNGNDLLVFSRHSCWENYYRKIKSISSSAVLPEYECLFEPDAIISTGEEKKKIILSSGIDRVMRFFSDNLPVKIAYREFGNTETYSQILVAGEKGLNLYVDRLNLISELNIYELNKSDKLIFDQTDDEHISLLELIPSIVDLRVLDPVQMHSFALQINYGEDNVRNYYIACFEERIVPAACIVDDHEFTYDILCSVHADENGNLCFSNGYFIPRHILYHRSFRQVQPDYTGTLVYDNNGTRIRSLYKLPLTEFKDHFSVQQYWGHPDECFGPQKAWMDDNGQRISDITISTEEANYENEITLVSVEPTYKYGFIKDDGTWLVPPIYNQAEKFFGGCAKVTRIEEREEKIFLLTKEGEEKTFDFPVDVESFTNNRCAFNVEKWTGESPDAGYYWDYDGVTPGKWGFIDSEGNIIVEPKYVFAVGFYNGGGEHSVVARYVGGKLCWGVIDLNGNEVIPCKYPGLYCRWGEAVAFQTEENGPYGVMDFTGEVIVEPQFDYVEEYDPKHRLVTVGEDQDHLGVYSVELGKMLIPTEYDCVDYYERMISCEPTWTCNERYFDYSGNELDFSEYDRACEERELLITWKDGKCGLIDWNKNVIIPEVYSEIYLNGDLVIASNRAKGNWCLNDSLFTIDGELIMSGTLRNMHIDFKKKRMSVETPTGVEVFELELEL